MDDGRVSVDRRRQQHVRRTVHRNHLKTFPLTIINLKIIFLSCGAVNFELFNISQKSALQMSPSKMKISPPEVEASVANDLVSQ